ncbi:Guanine nucleotide-binding protein subunit gamma [Spathaspora sp. JA1]|nr:Guanine nucleotide-binding protein subunit gamma [Spathaspora sp. JA1]
MENEQVNFQIQKIKLKRIQELITRLEDNLNRERIPASKACELIINYVEETPDYLIPYNWKLPPERNKFIKYKNYQMMKSKANGGCCTIT